MSGSVGALIIILKTCAKIKNFTSESIFVGKNETFCLEHSKKLLFMVCHLIKSAGESEADGCPYSLLISSLWLSPDCSFFVSVILLPDPSTLL